MYRCEALSVEGFIQQLTVGYIAKGYTFYVAGHVPEEKEPRAVDAKLIRRYEIDQSKWQRLRRRKKQEASIQYLRYGHFFVLLATEGGHCFFEEEAKVIYDVRQTPIKFEGYAVASRAGHASVRIERARYRVLKRHFRRNALKKSADEIKNELNALPFLRFRPVREQLLHLLHIVNRERNLAGLATISQSSLNLKRQSVRPFADSINQPALVTAPDVVIELDLSSRQ